MRLKDSLQQLFGDEGRIVKRHPVGGGDINTSSILILDGGMTVFLKENKASLEQMFAAEALGLKALREVATYSSAPPVPQVLAWGADEHRSYLLLEVIPSGKLKSAEDFGRSMAALHREGRSEQCGFDSDNWIGSTPQKNDTGSSWHDFFRDRRLAYQWQLARRKGFGDNSAEKQMQSVLRRIPELLPSPDDDRLSLLHGDLWGGNWLAGQDGRAWLIDPAVYYGHREADMAMTQLFGGFPSGFHYAYEEAWPLTPGFPERRDLYNLYHLLNHVNLFGSSYWRGARDIVAPVCLEGKSESGIAPHRWWSYG